MSENNDVGTFISGFVIGGLVGAAVALLLAPQSGEETRTLIKDRSIELRDKAVEYGQDARLRAEKAYEDARIRADEAIENLRLRSEHLADVVRERAVELQQTYKPVSSEAAPRKPAKGEAGSEEAPDATAA